MVPVAIAGDTLDAPSSVIDSIGRFVFELLWFSERLWVLLQSQPIRLVDLDVESGGECLIRTWAFLFSFDGADGTWVTFEFWYGKLFSFGDNNGASFEIKVNIEKVEDDATLENVLRFENLRYCVRNPTSYFLRGTFLRWDQWRCFCYPLSRWYLRCHSRRNSLCFGSSSNSSRWILVVFRHLPRVNPWEYAPHWSLVLNVELWPPPSRRRRWSCSSLTMERKTWWSFEIIVGTKSNWNCLSAVLCNEWRVWF